MRQPKREELRVGERLRAAAGRCLPRRVKPIGAPSCGNMPYHARRPGGAFSIASSTAPPHSPPSPSPGRSGRARAARARARRSSRRSAASRSRPSRCPSSAAPRRASLCGRRDRRSGRRAPTRSAGRQNAIAKVASDCSVAPVGFRAGRTAAGRPAPRRWRRCRSRRTRSSCRSGSRRGSASGSWLVDGCAGDGPRVGRYLHVACRG